VDIESRQSLFPGISALDVTKRANSMYTGGSIPGYGEWREVVKEFYYRLLEM